MTAVDGDPEPQAVPSGRVPWLVVLLAAGGTALLPDQRLLLEQVPMQPDPVDVALTTRFDDMGLTDLVPRELMLEVHVQAEDADAAIVAAGAVASGLVAMLSLAVNAFIPPAEPYLAFESAPGLNRRRFWQREVTLLQGVPRPTRQLKEALLFPLLRALFTSREAARLSRAVSQYHVALSHWTTRGRPLALAHLYMALEALAPAAERAERERLSLAGEYEHAQTRGVDVTRSNWKDVLLGWVRRDVLCQGDKATYDAARQASDGFEHGFMELPKYRAVAEQHGRALLDYVRLGLLNLLDLSGEVHEGLLSKRVLDASPLWYEISGELHGEVQDPARLAEAGQPYPYADWRTTLDDVRRLDDGRLRVTPRMNLTMHLADRVSLTVERYGLGVRLSDPDQFDYEPPSGEFEVIKSQHSADAPGTEHGEQHPR